MEATYFDKVMPSVIAGLLVWAVAQYAPLPKDRQPAPAPIIVPVPEKHRKPLLPWRDAGAKVGGDAAPDGTPVQIDLPQDQRLKNTGGRDGAGLCVFTSISMAARWQNVPVLSDFRDWMRQYPGGGYPEKVDAMIARKCKEAGVEVPQYVQVEGEDLDIIDLALKTGRMACATYGFSPSGRYNGQRISHMINVVHADGKNYAVLDNNYNTDLEWDSKSEFQRAYASDGGWTFVLLAPAPPPVPRNKK